MTDEIAPRLRIAQVFLLSATFRHRGEPLSLPHTTPVMPQRINVGFQLRSLNDSKAAQILVKVESAPEEGEDSRYEFAVEMTAILEKEGDTTAPPALLEIGAALLYPFVREVVANLTGRGRFGPVWLNPFNVRAAIKAQTAAETQQPAEATP